MGSKATAKAVKKVKKEKVIGHDNLEGEPIIERKPEPVKEAPREEAKKKEEVPLTKKAMRVCGCCPVELAPLPAGQKYFEAPDGHVIVGEADRGQVIDRRLNKGRGGWINPMR